MQTLIPTPQWSKVALSSHLEACALLEHIKDKAFSYITENHGSITEYDVQQLILQEFEKHDMETSDGDPIVGVNANSKDPHYTPTITENTIIADNDWVLIDIWAKLQGSENAYSDITWVGFTGPEVPAKHQEIFDIVITARNLVVQETQKAWQEKRTLEGWELDRVARDNIIKKGYGEAFIHTTGHSMGPGNSVHSPGVGLNDYSSHDTRPIIPNIGFSVEPGIYLPEFGMRSEIDVYMDPVKGPIVTTPQQDQIVIC